MAMITKVVGIGGIRVYRLMGSNQELVATGEFIPPGAEVHFSNETTDYYRLNAEGLNVGVRYIVHESAGLNDPRFVLTRDLEAQGLI